MRPITVGLIRVDTHSYYYGALMQKADPLLLRDTDSATHYYFYGSFTGKAGPSKIVVPTLRSFNIARVWDQDREKAERFSQTFYGKPRVCASFADVSDGVDLVFIANCYEPFSGSDHLELAAPGIRKHVPTFIDKPLAYEIEDARKIVRLARRHHTPITSYSLLRLIPHLTRFRQRFSEIAPVEFATIKGNGCTMGGQIHLVSIAQHLFGPGVEAVACIPGTGANTVECMNEPELAHIHLTYHKGPGKPVAGVVLNAVSGGTWHCRMYVNAYSAAGDISVRVGDFEFPYGAVEVLKRAKKMVTTGKPQVDYDEMLENIAVISAARMSAAAGKRIFLKDI